jgi:hypothetical protein
VSSESILNGQPPVIELNLTESPQFSRRPFYVSIAVKSICMRRITSKDQRPPRSPLTSLRELQFASGPTDPKSVRRSLPFAPGGGGVATALTQLSHRGIGAVQSKLMLLLRRAPDWRGYVAWLRVENESPVPRGRITQLGSYRAYRDGSSC